MMPSTIWSASENWLMEAESSTVSQEPIAFSSLGSKWWRWARTVRTAWIALMWRSARGGLEDDGVGVALLGEIAHEGERKEGVLVVGAVVGGVLDFVAEDADHVEDLAFDLHCFADGRVAVEEFLRGVGAEDDDLAVVGEVGGLEVAALFDDEVAHLAVGQIDGLGLDVDDLGAVVEGEAAVGLGGDSFQKRNGVTNGFDVAVAELDFLAGAFAAGLHGGLSTPDHDDVVADAHEAVEDLLAERAAVAEEEDDGDEPPGDAEHGERGAEAVADESLERLAEDFGEVHRVLRRMERRRRSRSLHSALLRSG